MRDVLKIIKNHLKGIVAALDTAEKQCEEERLKELKKKFKNIKQDHVK